MTWLCYLPPFVAPPVLWGGGCNRVAEDEDDDSSNFCLVLGDTGGRELFRSESNESKLLMSDTPTAVLLPLVLAL